MNSLPSLPFNLSVKGLKFKVPATVMATTRSGEVTKEWVAGLPSLRPVKLRLYEEMIEFGSRRSQFLWQSWGAGDTLASAFHILSVPLALSVR